MLKRIRTHELLTPLLTYMANKAGTKIDDVILGNVVGPGGNIARLSVLEAGLPLHVPGLTLDRQCSAGLEAIRMACYLVQGGAGKSYIAGGVESTSSSPFLERARFSPEKIGDPDMGVAAENVALMYGITREMQDDYTLLSYERSIEAYQNGLYNQEILPIGSFLHDEELGKKRHFEKLVKRAQPVFLKNKGTVTAANSCGIHDGASIVLVMEESEALKRDFQPVLRFVDSEVSGVDPNYPAIAPVPSIKNLLLKNHLEVGDIGLIETTSP